MEPETFDVEISVSHADELRKANRKKFDRLIDKLHEGLLNFPGVGCVCGPNVEATEDEKEEWDHIEREGEARRKQEIKEALGRVMKEPEFREILKSRLKEVFASPEYQAKLAAAIRDLPSEA